MFSTAIACLSREECNLLQSKTVDEEQSHDETLREMNNKLAALQEQKRREMDVLKSQVFKIIVFF